MANYIFELKDKVRDYECDLQGIVNNANYQHYLEHCRHEFLLAHNISFAELHEKGTDAVVARLTMQFKVPLKSRDEYVTKLWYFYAGHFPSARHEAVHPCTGGFGVPREWHIG